MSAEFSTYGANQVLDGVAVPATLYLKMHIGNPGAAGANNAAAETSRKSFTRATSSGGATSNLGNIDWTGLTNVETWTHWTAWDASVAGNCWMCGTLVSSATIASGDSARCAIGDLDLSITVWS